MCIFYSGSLIWVWAFGIWGNCWNIEYNLPFNYIVDQIFIYKEFIYYSAGDNIIMSIWIWHHFIDLIDVLLLYIVYSI